VRGTRSLTSDLLGLHSISLDFLFGQNSQNNHIFWSFFESLMTQFQSRRIHESTINLRPPSSGWNPVFLGIFERCDSLPDGVFILWKFLARYLENTFGGCFRFFCRGWLDGYGLPWPVFRNIIQGSFA
jgi:hypothetical protein